MSPDTATRPPRSAAARRAAGETELSAVTEGKDASTVEAGESDLRAQLERAQEEARLAQEELQLLREQQEAVAAGAPPEPISQPMAPASVSGPAPSSGVALPASAVPGAPLPEGITPDDMRLLERLKQGRELEILERLREAPTAIGTDLDQYTLVHLRGCPNPNRTETYPSSNSSTGERFTIHRCVECGAHLTIPH